jgi:hypothetical protein
MKSTLPAIVVFTGFAALLLAQTAQSVRARIRGGGGDVGKCTIEVDVDGVAEVEVRGDTGRIRTLQGQPSQWRRFECTSPIPRNPVDFRFKGADGRGNVQLVRDPNTSGGAAVVRIEDRQGGREGYTFDLEWRGGAGAYSSNNPNDPYYGTDRRSRRNDRDYDPNNPYHRDDRSSRNGNVYGNSDANRAVGVCQDAIRARARRDYDVRNPSFTSSNIDDQRGSRDRVIGSFQGNRGEQYDYSCSINTNNGDIRSVDIRRR